MNGVYYSAEKCNARSLSSFEIGNYNYTELADRSVKKWPQETFINKTAIDLLK